MPGPRLTLASVEPVDTAASERLRTKRVDNMVLDYYDIQITQEDGRKGA